MSVDWSRPAHALVQATVALPPLLHRGRFVKGILLSSSADALVQSVPQVKDCFHVVAYSAHPDDSLLSRSADARLTDFVDDARDAAFRQMHPDYGAQALVPFAVADFFNEHCFAPRAAEKIVDVLAVANHGALTHLPLFLRALQIVHAQASGRRIHAVCLTDGPSDLNAILGVAPEICHFVPTPSDVRAPLRSAKVFVHPTVAGPKSAIVLHAMACDVPVVTLPAYNVQAYTGGVRDVRTGLTSPGDDPENFASAIALTLANAHQFRPRDSLLRESGRRHMFNALIDALPYYASALPDYERGAHEYNRWIDAALTDCYGTYLHAFLFNDAPPGMTFSGLDAIRAMVAARAKLLAAMPAEPQAVVQCA